MLPVLGVGVGVTDNGLVVILVLHIRDIVLLLVIPLGVAGLVDGADLLSLEGLRTRQAARPQPALVVAAVAAARASQSISDNSLLVAGDV